MKNILMNQEEYVKYARYHRKSGEKVAIRKLCCILRGEDPKIYFQESDQYLIKVLKALGIDYNLNKIL